jgi:zinc transport system substrate-binding protein
MLPLGVTTRIVLIAATLALGLAAAGCGGGSGPASDPNAEQVVAGFYPLAFAAEEIGGDGVAVTNLTAAGAEPHDVELTPKDVERIHEADLVLYLGEGFQPALEDAVEASGTPAIDALEAVELREGEDDEGHDPHVWLDPIRFAQVVERIGAELGGEAPARQLASQLRALDGEYREGLADCARRQVVTTHDAFGYLADRYDLELIPVAGLSPEAEPTPRDLESVANLVRSSGVTTVYVEPLVSSEIGETVAREAGVETAVLNPLEVLTEDELADGVNYFSVMEANLEALRAGLGCR